MVELAKKIVSGYVIVAFGLVCLMLGLGFLSGVGHLIREMTAY